MKHGLVQLQRLASALPHLADARQVHGMRRGSYHGCFQKRCLSNSKLRLNSLGWNSVEILAHMSSRQSCARSGRGASQRRSHCVSTALRCSGAWPNRETRCIRCAIYARTTAMRMMTKRAARAAVRPGSSAPQRRAPAQPGAALQRGCGYSQGTPTTPLARGRRHPAGTISVAARSATLGSACAARFVNTLIAVVRAA